MIYHSTRQNIGATASVLNYSRVQGKVISFPIRNETTIPTGPSEVQSQRASVLRNEDALQLTLVGVLISYVFWWMCILQCVCVWFWECCNGAEFHVVAVHKWLHVEDCKLYNRRWFEVAVQTIAESDSPRQTYINIQTQTDTGCLKQCWITVTQLQCTAAGLEYEHTHKYHTHTYILEYINSQIQSSFEGKTEYGKQALKKGCCTGGVFH